MAQIKWKAEDNYSIWGLPKISLPDWERPKYISKYEYNDDMSEESLNEDSISEGGEAKKRKLETDPLFFSDPSNPSCSHGESGGVRKSKTCEEMLEEHKILNFIVELVKCNFLQSDLCPEEILDLMKDKVDAIPEDACLWIIRKMDFKAYISHIHSSYEVIKRLYENVPYIMGHEKVGELRKMVDLTSPPFHLFDDSELAVAMQIYGELRCRTGSFFHPLLRKSYKNEFFSIVDAAEKIKERNFVMMFWRTHLYARDSSFFRELSRSKGLRDAQYMHCCNQIKLQEDLDIHLHYYRKIVQDNVNENSMGGDAELIRLSFEHDGVIENLMGNEAVVPKKFKDVLHPELIRLSLEAFIKSYSRKEHQKRAYMQLQSLEDARLRNETSDVDKMLIDLHSEFPCIVNFSNESPVDNALEERFRDVVHKLKEMWFPNIADHYVVKVTLLYIRHLVSEAKREASWPTKYFRRSKFYEILPEEICHEHWMYQHVMDVEFLLP